MLRFYTFLDRLESGFLLYETQRGMVRVELTFWQRVYLLWTFRNFRQLSILLLNSRQQTLVRALYSSRPSFSPHSDELGPVIGMIENFVAPAMEIDASPIPQSEVTEEAPSAPREEKTLTANRIFAFSALPRAIWLRIATTISVLLLCILSVIAWHRGKGVSTAQATDRGHLEQIDERSSDRAGGQYNERGEAALRYSAKPVVLSENVAVAVPSAARGRQGNSQKVIVKSASIHAALPTRNWAVGRDNSVSTSRQPTLSQDTVIQASRAPSRCVYPTYPNARLRGKVALTARVGSDGVVRAVRVVSGDRTLAAAAVRAVRQWRYHPYLKDGQPVATETNVSISFIPDAISMSFPPSVSSAQ